MKRLLICCFLFSTLIGCSQKIEGEGEIRTDVEPIERRLVNLPEIADAKWKFQKFGSGGGGVPGPSGYRIWGYAQYNQEDLSTLTAKFADIVEDESFSAEFPYADEESYVWNALQGINGSGKGGTDSWKSLGVP